jgi:hypothetical protein
MDLNKMVDILKAINRIRHIPSLLPNSSIYSLDAYISACDDIARDLGEPITEEKQELNMFYHWLRNEKYKSISSNLRWSSLILYDSDNERDALEKFFELLDEFTALKNSNDNLEVDKNLL